MDGNDNRQNGQDFNSDPLSSPMNPVVNQDPFRQNTDRPQADFSQSAYQAQGGINKNPYSSQVRFDQNPYSSQGGFGQNQYQQQGGFGQNQYQQGGYQQNPGYQGYQPNNIQPNDMYSQSQYGYGQQQYYPPQQEPTAGFSIASLITGVLSILLICCLRWWDILLAVPAIVFGILGIRKEPNGKAMSIIGIICGALSLILILVLVIIALTLTSRIKAMGSAGFQQWIMEMMEEAIENGNY